MTESSYRIVDADHHYYEPDDCFTRHLESEFRDRAFHIERKQGVGIPHFGREASYYLRATPADRMGRPGVRAADKDSRYRPLEEEDLLCPGQIPHFVDRDARVDWMEGQGIEAALLWPSLGLTVEWQLRDDLPACVANLRSFNRWLDESWGFAYERRIFAVPWLTLVDLPSALRELDWVLARGARVVHLLFTPVAGKTVAHPDFDPFWARLAEARVPVGLHGAEAG